MSSDEIDDILDEMEDSREFEFERNTESDTSFFFYVKNVPWKFTTNFLPLSVSCCSNQGAYWSVNAEFDIKVNRKTDDEVIFDKRFEKKFYSRRERDHSFEVPWYSFGEESVKIAIKTRVMKVENLIRFSNHYLEKLSNDDESNVLLLIGNKKFRVNKQYLSMHSPVFDAMFNSEFNEKTQKEIAIHDIDCYAFKDFIRILYFRNTSIWNVSTADGIAKIADRYQVQLVLDYCENWLIRHLYKQEHTAVNYIKILKIADGYKFNHLQNAFCESTQKSNLIKLKNHTAFESLSKCSQLAVRRALD